MKVFSGNVSVISVNADPQLWQIENKLEEGKTTGQTPAPVPVPVSRGIGLQEFTLWSQDHVK